MAQKNLASRISRTRSSIVSQLHKLIVRYSPLVPIRERAYINRIAHLGDCLYWLEENKSILVAAVLIENDFNLKLGGAEITNIGCFVSSKPGTMERILEHIWQDIGHKSIYTLCRPFLAESLGLINQHRKLVKYSADEIKELYPELANSFSGYYNMPKQTFYQGMVANQSAFYIQLSSDDLDLVAKNSPKFVETYHQRISDLV